MEDDCSALATKRVLAITTGNGKRLGPHTSYNAEAMQRLDVTPHKRYKKRWGKHGMVAKRTIVLDQLWQGDTEEEANQYL